MNNFWEPLEIRGLVQNGPCASGLTDPSHILPRYLPLSEPHTDPQANTLVFLWWEGQPTWQGGAVPDSSSLPDVCCVSHLLFSKEPLASNLIQPITIPQTPVALSSPEVQASNPPEAFE